MTAPYLLVGSGRLSRHLQHYLGLEAIRWRQWDRSSSVPLSELLVAARAVLLLISDDAIEGFLNQYAVPGGPPWVHCSGSLTTDLASGFHPLMAFGDELYDQPTYRRMAFVGERGRTAFSELFPELPNPCFEIDPGSKSLYHALCTMAGNFSTLVWLKAFADFEERLGIPAAALHPYLEQITANLEGSISPLTGPLARGDRNTVATHLSALQGDPYREVYRAFVAAYGITTPGSDS